MNTQLQEMLDVNRVQAAYYDERKRNVATRFWRHLRGGVVRQCRVDNRISDLVMQRHREWLPDLRDKKVLDLGCGGGNPLSFHLAEQAGRYVGLDLSENSIRLLRQRLNERGLSTADAVAADFLSPEFTERDFDVIYAYGVLHHFRHFDVLLARLHEVLSDDGIIISHDPLATAPSVRLARAVYRPFQTDAAWEWPFTRQTFQALGETFDIAKVQGYLGRSKWAIPLYLVPWIGPVRRRVGGGLHQSDSQYAIAVNERLWGCMAVSMRLEKKQT